MKLPLMSDEGYSWYNFFSLINCEREADLWTPIVFQNREWFYGREHASKEPINLTEFCKLLPKAITVRAIQNEVYFIIGDSCVSFYGKREGVFKECNETLVVTGFCVRDRFSEENLDDIAPRNVPHFIVNGV